MDLLLIFTALSLLSALILTLAIAALCIETAIAALRAPRKGVEELAALPA